MEQRIERVFDVELRAIKDEEKRCEGYAVVFNKSTDLGWFTEEIDKDAFNDADMSSTFLLFNHDPNIVLAGTQNKSLELKIDKEGLFQRSNIIATSQGKDIYELVKQGIITKMSFGFTIDRDGGEEWISGEEKEHRIIKKVKKLFDVSLVTYPAYDQTSAYARSIDNDELLKEHQRRKEQNKKMEELLNGRNA